MNGICFTAIDFETANTDRLSACSIGLCAVEDGKIVKKAYHLVNPPAPVRNFGYVQTMVHGLTYEDVKDSGEFCDIWNDIEPMIKGKTLVAHNMPFDRSVLNKLTSYYSLPETPSGYLCTLKLARKAFPTIGTYKLDRVCDFLGFPMKDHHQAGADAEASAKILIYFAKSHSYDNIKEVLSYMNQPAGRYDNRKHSVAPHAGDNYSHRPEKPYIQCSLTETADVTEVPNSFLKDVIRERHMIGELRGKVTAKQLEFIISLRRQTNIPLFKSDIESRYSALKWISRAVDMLKMQKNSSYGDCR